MTVPRGLQASGNSPARSRFRSVSGVVPGIRAASPIYTSPLSMTGMAGRRQHRLQHPATPGPKPDGYLPPLPTDTRAAKPGGSRDYP